MLYVFVSTKPNVSYALISQSHHFIVFVTSTDTNTLRIFFCAHFVSFQDRINGFYSQHKALTDLLFVINVSLATERVEDWKWRCEKNCHSCKGKIIDFCCCCDAKNHFQLAIFRNKSRNPIKRGGEKTGKSSIFHSFSN